VGRSALGALCLGGVAVEGAEKWGADGLGNESMLIALIFFCLLSLSAVFRVRFNIAGDGVMKVSLLAALALHLALRSIAAGLDHEGGVLGLIALVLLLCFVLSELASRIARFSPGNEKA